MPEQTCTAEALNDLRQRYLAGKDWTREELKIAIHTMIGQRLIDVQAAAQPKAKKVKAQAISLDDMLPGQAPIKIGVDLAAGPDATETKRIEATKENKSNVPKPVSNPSGSFF